MRRALALLVGCLVLAPAAQADIGAPASATRTSRLLGNGGYDAQHYDLTLSYDPDDRTGSTGTARDHARAATQDLSRFDLDLSAA